MNMAVLAGWPVAALGSRLTVPSVLGRFAPAERPSPVPVAAGRGLPAAQGAGA
ncbi:hypothetical protein [Spirillospora sp. NPDC048819]|uniref:hypothetical protein n=1 Tax=Spirillospora sp. NPDC048819 TaxID=3155268 RepID=UPI0033EDCA58